MAPTGLNLSNTHFDCNIDNDAIAVSFFFDKVSIKMIEWRFAQNCFAILLAQQKHILP